MITFDIRASDMCSNEYSIFISFQYNTKILNIIQAQSTRYWHKDTKEWEIPTRKLSTLISDLKDYDIKIIGDFNKAFGTEPKKETTYTFKTKPFKHQIDGFNFGCTHDRWLLADEQGLGKTKQVIDIAIHKKQTEGYKHCLIICGINSLKWNWVNEVQTHSNETAYIFGQRIKKHKIQIGSNTMKLDDINNIDNIDSYFLITNVESLRNKDICTKLSEYTKNGKIQMVAIDEIHKCKNPSSQQGKGILKLTPECRIAMTGTPLMNTPLDLYIVLKWLGFEKHSFYAFKNHYCVMGGFGGYEVIGYRHMNELQDKLTEIMLRRRKEDVLDLPEKIYIDDYVDMTGKQEQIYKEVNAMIKANIDKIQFSNNPLAELIRLRQATGYTGIISSNIKESAKLDRMEEIVEECIDNNRKIVIFSNWTQMTDAIIERVSKYGCVQITGETTDEDRPKCVDKFQNDTNTNIIVGTIGAMGTGLTLTAGTVVIFLDEPWNMALKDQAIDRCHRIGTKSNITIYTLMCKNTIDERIHDIVERKGVMSNVIVDNKINMDKKELVQFLLS